MGSPTDELRARLNELGVECGLDASSTHRSLWWRVGGVSYSATEVAGKVKVTAYYLTPEQAIAATVGNKDVSALRAKVKAQSDYIDKLRGEYKALDEQMERTCAEYRATIRKLKAELDAATVGAETCRNLSSGGEFTCSECGYNVVEGCEGDFDGFRHCPNCGRRIEEESE